MFRPCNKCARGSLLTLLAFSFFLPVTVAAQSGAPNRYLSDRKLWVLDTQRATYVVGVNEAGQLQNVYWGKKLGRDEDLQALLEIYLLHRLVSELGDHLAMQSALVRPACEGILELLPPHPAA